MHIKRMHEMIEKVTECANSQLAKGTDSVDTQEMKEVACIIKELAEAEYYSKISKAMDETDEAEKYMRKYLPEMSYARMNYGDERYYTIGRGGRPSRVRYSGSRYYSGNGGSNYNSVENYANNSGNNSGNNGGGSGRRNYTRPYMYMDEEIYSDIYPDYHDEYDGDSWKYRRSYMESKKENGNNYDSSKELNEYVKSLTDDIMEMVENASPQEKSILKQKISTLATKIE